MPPHEQAQKHLDEANKLAEESKFNAAFREFETAIRLYYSFAKAYADYGNALVKAGQYPEAIEKFKKAAELDSAIGFDVDKLATAFGHDSRQKQHLDEFQKIVDSAGSADLIHTWAQVLTELQQYERAIEEFKKTLTKNPELNLNTESLVRALEKSGTIEHQIDLFQKTIDDLKTAAAWNSWGLTLLFLRRYIPAADQFKTASDAKRDWAVPHVNLGSTLIELSQYQESIDALKTGLKYDKPFIAYLELGLALNRNEQYQEAVSNYKTAAETTPSDQYFAPWLEAIKKLPNADSALADYQQALEKCDKTELLASAYADLGTFLHRLNRRPEAAIQFAKSLTIDGSELPGNYATQMNLAQTITDIEKPDDTLKTIQSIFDATADPKRSVQWCLALAGSNQTDLAIQQFSKVIADLPKLPSHDSILVTLAMAFKSAATDGVALARIGEELAQKDNGDLQVAWARILRVALNDPEQSFSMYKKLLLNKPKSAGLVQDFIEAIESSSNQQSTITDLRAAVNDTSNAEVCYHWALILTAFDESKAALEELKRAISLDKNHVDAHFKLGQLYNEQGNYSKAWEQFQKTLELDQDRIDAVREVGTVLLNSGQPEEAIAKYLEVIRDSAAASPMDSSDLLAIRDSLTWDDKMVERFQKVFDEINKPESYCEWGVFLVKVKHPQRAIEQFKKAIELDPDSTTVYPEWLKALGACGLPPQLLSEYEESILEYRKNAVAYSDLGDFLYRLKRTDEAVRSYRQALELDPKEAGARIGLIYCLMDLNNIKEAREEAQRLQADSPKSGAAHDCLSWCDFLDGKYQEAIKRCELGISQGIYYLYDTCARAWFKLQEKDKALGKYDEALKERPDDVDILFSKVVLLMEMNRYPEATAILEHILKLKPEHTYANHNLAALAYDRGRYEEAWEQWKKTIKVYEQQGSLLTRVIDGGRNVDSNEAYNYASIVLYILHKPDEAERILKEGRDFHPNNTLILGLLAGLYWDNKEGITELDAESCRKKTELHKLGMDCFQKAEKLLLERSNRYQNYSILIELGDLYLLNKDYENARKYFEQAKERDSTAYLPYGKLGVAYLRDRKADQAIPLLLQALELNPGDLDLKSSLAEAYLRAEKLSDAEIKYREVLNLAPNHVQSSIGLGELCSALGEKDPDRYSEAIDLFTKALELAENEKSRSKYLTKTEKAAAYYQIGFACVQCYESSGIRRDTKLLDQARKDFDKCITLNPSHQKAKRAKEKIEKRLAFFTRDRLTETVGPRSIYRMSIAVFVLVQIAFFVAPLFNQPSYKVTDRSVRAVEKDLTAEQLQSLKGLVNQKFGDREMLSKILQPLPGNVAETVLENVDAIKPIENAPDLPVGYYALLTFGSLLFMVVGLYLPQILKLKVPGIELEKSSIDQAGVGDQAFAGGTLGISKP